jgi:hypothetical protein
MDYYYRSIDYYVFWLLNMSIVVFSFSFVAVDTGEDDSVARRGGTGGDGDLTAGLDGTLNASTAPPSLDARTKFASNLFRLNGEELGYVLQIIDLRCPHAVENIRPSMEEPAVDEDGVDNVKKEKDIEAEINVDAIDPKTFSELDRYMKEKLYSRDASSSSHHHHHNTVKDVLSMTASTTATTSSTTASQKRRKTK